MLIHTDASADKVRAVWTVPQLAKWLGCSQNTIYDLINSKKLAAFGLTPQARRKNWRVYHSAVEAFVNAQASAHNGPG